MSTPTIVTSGQSRVWTLEGGAGPFTEPEYQGCMKAGDPSWPQGDITPIQCPDPNAYKKFVEANQIRGAQERVTFPLNGRYPNQLSSLMQMAARGCRVDIQVLIGSCRNPQDYATSWEKMVVFPDGRLTNYGIENFGAIEGGEQNPTNENADISAEEMYEIVKLGFAQLGSVSTVREIISIDVCDSPSCGDECGAVSDGCQKVFATMIGTGATPGTSPSVLYTSTGGAVSWAASSITTLAANEAPTDSECVGENFVVTSNVGGGLEYAPLADILAGTATWTEVTTGLVAGKYPNAIWSVDPRHTWVVGDGGYIYFTDDPTTGVDVQDAGVATVQNLSDVHAYNSSYVLVVGASNAVAYAENGGATWQAVTGPAVGVALTCCWMLSLSMWMIGDAGGNLWATNNSGATWTDMGMPASVTAIDNIYFVDGVEGYMAVEKTGTVGYLMRTTNGGNSWSFLPESGKGTMPAADRFNDIAPCGHNLVFAAGLDGGGTLGMIVKGVGG